MSVLRRMRRPKPCLNRSTAWGRPYWSKGASNCWERAAKTGSLGTLNGSLVMTRTLSASPGDIDAFPEATRAEDDGARVGLKALDELGGVAVLALGKHGDLVSRKQIGEEAARRPQGGPRREEDEHPPTGGARRVSDGVVDRRLVARSVGLGDVVGEEAKHAVGIVERRADHELVR